MKIRIHYYIVKALIEFFPVLFFRYFKEYKQVLNEWKVPTYPGGDKLKYPIHTFVRLKKNRERK